ncbi:MAG TPA: PilZ domain-containing protein [Candidatus Scalindua sp.]|nr:PilZ domain-containing protein [Candidatus Scalindua sp.]
MIDQLKGTEKRFDKRLEISLPIRLLDDKFISKNISPGGIYFEVITDDIEKYSPGKIITIEITASTSTHEISSQIIKLTGIGVITRIDKLFSDPACFLAPWRHAAKARRRGEKLGVALKFSNKLELSVKNANYYSRSKHSVVNPE